jgi:RimJ/RimL family protein N-acetyltransferase
MAEIMKFGFGELDLKELRLNVFDFNSAAISCYRKAGFKAYEIKKNAREVDNEKWNLVRMNISREEYGKA